MVRTLETMNLMIMLLTFLMGYLGTIAKKINEKLLGIKLLYASQSLVDNQLFGLASKHESQEKSYTMPKMAFKHS